MVLKAEGVVVVEGIYIEKDRTIRESSLKRL